MKQIQQLKNCIVLNEHNTAFARSGISIASAVFARLIGDRPTDRPTDHATRSVAINGAHSGEAKFCYCLWLQQVFIGAVDPNTPCLSFLRKRSPDGATPY